MAKNNKKGDKDLSLALYKAERGAYKIAKAIIQYDNDLSG